jgi:hypothetical protein
MTAAGSLAPALRAATYQTLVGLLAVSGLFSGGVNRTFCFYPLFCLVNG